MTKSLADSINGLPPLRDIIASHGLNARRKLGQHFLLDLNLTRRIAAAASDLSLGTILEIGPGPGGLTRSLLLEGAERIIAIERDERCIRALSPLIKVAAGRLSVHHGDALDVGLESLGPAPIRIIANLPYNIATPLLIHWLRAGKRISEMVLMFQLEVAERIAATVGDKAYGRLAVLSNWCAETKFLFKIPARAFTPSPRVDSAVVRLTPFHKPRFSGNVADIELVTAAAFGQRRKTLRRSLLSLGVSVGAMLERSCIDGGLRAEELDVSAFASLATALSDLREDL